MCLQVGRVVAIADSQSIFGHNCTFIITTIQWHLVLAFLLRDDHDHAPEKSLGVVILNVFLARFGGLLSCSPCGGRFELEATLSSRVDSIAWVTGSTDGI